MSFFFREKNRIIGQKWAGFALLLALAAALGGCGYSFPHLKDDGTARVIYMTDWENRTQKLALDSQIHQNLTRWFRKSAAFRLTKNREGADYVLAGEILSIDMPSVAWADRARATDVKMTLVVRYVVKDLKSGAIVWEVPGKVYTSDYQAEMEVSAYSEVDALNEIVGDLAEDIYIGLMHRIRRQEQMAARAAAGQPAEEGRAVPSPPASPEQPPASPEQPPASSAPASP